MINNTFQNVKNEVCEKAIFKSNKRKIKKAKLEEQKKREEEI